MPLSPGEAKPHTITFEKQDFSLAVRDITCISSPTVDTFSISTMEFCTRRKVFTFVDLYVGAHKCVFLSDVSIEGFEVG